MFDTDPTLTGQSVDKGFTVQLEFDPSTFGKVSKVFKGVKGKGVLEGSLDDVIQRNNDWDPSITSASDLAKLMEGKGWNLSRGIAYKPRNAKVIPEDAEAMEALHGSSWDDFVRADMRRSNDTLMEYGGGETYNVDPVNAILDQFQSASHGYAMRAYTYNSMVAWVKRAQQKGSGITFDANIKHNRLPEAIPVYHSR